MRTDCVFIDGQEILIKSHTSGAIEDKEIKKKHN